MRRVILSSFAFAALMVAPTVIMAQTSGLIQKINAPYVLPQSGVKVALKVACEKIEKGPYAKFSQQLLGVTASLNDRTTYTILEGALASYNEGDASNIYMLSDSKAAPLEVIGMEVEFDNAANSDNVLSTTKTNTPSFTDLSITPISFTSGSAVSADRTSTREKSVEEMAADAANTIFTLRKRRFDLITGESSENAFGAGLGAAVEEMKRIENEYLALFVGKKTIQVKDFIFEVVPKKGQNNYVVCRFTKEGGIVDATDMSGEPILLVVTPEGRIKASTDKKAIVKGAVTYRSADMAECKLFNSQSLLEVRRLPMLQYGVDIEVLPVR